MNAAIRTTPTKLSHRETGSKSLAEGLGVGSPGKPGARGALPDGIEDPLGDFSEQTGANFG